MLGLGQVAAYRAIYGPQHPLLGLQLYTWGNLHVDLGKVCSFCPRSASVLI